MGCKHLRFNANVTVNWLEDSSRFNADIRIECADCHLAFKFIGLPQGLDLNGPAMSVDGQEARLAILPVGIDPAPIKGVSGFNIKSPIKQ